MPEPGSREKQSSIPINEGASFLHKEKKAARGVSSPATIPLEVPPKDIIWHESKNCRDTRPGINTHDSVARAKYNRRDKTAWDRPPWKESGVGLV